MQLTFMTLCGGGMLFFVAFLVYAIISGSDSLRRYIITRIFLTIPMIFILVTLIFVVMRLIPGDPITANLKPGASTERIEALQADLGLDKPIYLQYVDYLTSIVRGDLGNSAVDDRPITEMIGEALPATIELIIPSVLIMMIFGVASGAYAAHHHKSAADYSLRVFSVFIYSFPVFWVGLIFQLIFAVQLGWFPVAKRISPTLEFERQTNLLLVDTLLAGNWEAFADAAQHLVLPTAALSLALIGVFIRLTRVNMIETLEEDFVRAGYARGIPERRMVYRHALRNTLIPVMTLIGLQTAILLAGAILTETTFSWPGMGLMIRDGIDQRDYPAVQGAVTVFAIFVALISLLTDILYAFIDPRIRY